jgi:molybdopterin synthase sulfurtransferase
MPTVPASPCLPSADRAAPRGDLARARHLLSAQQLQPLLHAQAQAATDGHAALQLFEVIEGRTGSAMPARIPGACWLDVQQLEQPPMWNKVSDTQLLAQLQALGIRHDSTVVLAGRQRVANARVAHLLLYAGVRDVRLLDGGTDAWIAAGLPLTDTPAPPPVPATDFGLHLPACPHYLIDTAQVHQLLAQPQATLVSVRTWGEFIGKTSGYDYITACGEIAGARWGHAGADGDVNDMGAFHTPAGLMKPARDILQLWANQGIHPGGHVAFYCGTGWRASLAFFYAWLMGWDDISVYDGGWLEWSSDPRNPVVNRQTRQQAATTQQLRNAGA